MGNARRVENKIKRWRAKCVAPVVVLHTADERGETQPVRHVEGRHPAATGRKRVSGAAE